MTRKITSVILMIAIVFSMSVNAFAASEGRTVPGTDVYTNVDQEISFANNLRAASTNGINIKIKTVWQNSKKVSANSGDNDLVFQVSIDQRPTQSGMVSWWIESNGTKISNVEKLITVANTQLKSGNKSITITDSSDLTNLAVKMSFKASAVYKCAYPVKFESGVKTSKSVDWHNYGASVEFIEEVNGLGFNVFLNRDGVSPHVEQNYNHQYYPAGYSIPVEVWISTNSQSYKTINGTYTITLSSATADYKYTMTLSNDELNLKKNSFKNDDGSTTEHREIAFFDNDNQFTMPAQNVQDLTLTVTFKSA